VKSLIIIPARKGSKRLPNKNIKLLNGKPLINYTVEHARKLFDDNIICVSTDSNEIKSIVEKTGLKVPFLRPKHLAEDLSSTQEVILDCLDWYKNKKNYIPDNIILLQPTSPLRKIEYTKKALKKYNNKLDMVVSVKKSRLNHKTTFAKVGKQDDIKKIDLDKNLLELNGSVYVINTSSIKNKEISKFSKIKKVTIREEELSIDIDTQLDFDICELIIRKSRE